MIEDGIADELTFNGFPYHDTRDGVLLPYDIGILGAPLDAGSSVMMRGQAMTPFEVRRLEHIWPLYHPEDGFYSDLSLVVGVADFGDSEVEVMGAPMAHFDDLRLVVGDARQCANTLVVIGGDHSITPIVLDGMGENLPVFHVDAHHDCASYDKNNVWDHANWVRYALDMNLAPHIYQFGVRAYGEYFAEPRLTRYAGTYLSQLQQALLLASQCPTDVYVSIDVDVVDPAYAPGVVYREPGGWTGSELLEFITAICATGKVRGLDLVECNPLRDRDELTVRLVHRALLASIRGVAIHKVTLAQNQRTGESDPAPGSDSEGGSGVR